MKHFSLNLLKIFLPAIVFFMIISFADVQVFAQTGCTLLNKNKSVISISYEQELESRKAPTVRFRLINNSSCAIVVPIDISEVAAIKSQACVPSTFLELEDNSQVLLIYEIYYPKTNTIYFPLSGDVVSSALLKSGQSILFDVPIKRLKNGDLKLNFDYDWEICNSANQYRRLSLDLSSIPKNLLKKWF